MWESFQNGELALCSKASKTTQSIIIHSPGNVSAMSAFFNPSVVLETLEHSASHLVHCFGNLIMDSLAEVRRKLLNLRGFKIWLLWHNACHIFYLNFHKIFLLHYVRVTRVLASCWWEGPFACSVWRSKIKITSQIPRPGLPPTYTAGAAHGPITRYQVIWPQHSEPHSPKYTV